MARKVRVVWEELSDEQHKWLRKHVEDFYARAALKAWTDTKRELKAIIAGFYHTHFPRGKFNIVDQVLNGFNVNSLKLQIRHCYYKLQDRLSTISYQARTQGYIKSYLRKAYVLDMTTPPTVSVNIPKVSKSALMKEARPFLVSQFKNLKRLKEAALPSYETRWNTFLQGYADATNYNVDMAMMSEQNLDDLLYEVGNERIGYPAFQLDTVIDRTIRQTAIDGISDGGDDIIEANEDLIEEPIWQTMEDADVCPICDPNNGLTQSEVDDDIPAHFYCRCYWKIAPRNWEELSGQDLGDYQDQMITLDENGNIQDVVVVSFWKWLTNK